MPRRTLSMDISGLTAFLFTLEGRASRKDYWLRLGIPIVLASLIARSAGAGAISMVLMPPVVWCVFAAAVKRFHDLGRGGIWALLILVPFLHLAVALFLGFAPSEVGDNAFGRRRPD